MRLLTHSYLARSHYKIPRYALSLSGVTCIHYSKNPPDGLFSFIFCCLKLVSELLHADANRQVVNRRTASRVDDTSLYRRDEWT